jgi:hypothetical protein
MHHPDGAAREWVSIVAARLQDRDVSRSAFVDAVRANLAWDDGPEQGIVRAPLHTLFT